MWSLAVSAVLLLPSLLSPVFPQGREPLFGQAGGGGFGGRAGVRQAPTTFDPSYQQLLPSLMTLMDGPEPRGTAVMIDPTGLYIAHRASAVGPDVEGRLASGKLVHMHVVGQDGCTQLILLRSDEVPVDAHAVSPPVTETDPGTPLIVVLPDGVVHARVESNEKLGLIRPSNRLIPLTEIRFESTTEPLAGALLFTLNGDFVGDVNATLPRSAQLDSNLAASPIIHGRQQKFDYVGPGSLTVAYTAGVDVVHKLFEGFLSPDHVVEHPSLGIFCANAGDGALVKTMQEDSTAAKAGLREGDVIKGIGSYLIRNQLDFAKVMFRQQPDSKVYIRVDRRGHTMFFQVTIGKVAD